MKYAIHYTCGHEGEASLVGPGARRERRIEAMEREVCPECQAAAVARHAEANGLPQLSGSPKQVAWAGGLRVELVGQWAREVAHAEGHIKDGEASAVSPEVGALICAAARADLEARRGWTSARAWIDARDTRAPFMAALAGYREGVQR